MTYGIAYFELDSDPTLFDTVVRALAEGVSFRSASRIFEIDKDTTLGSLIFMEGFLKP